MTHTNELTNSRVPGQPARERRGAALITTMMFVGAIGGVALASVYLAGNASLVSKSYDKEAELKYAAEAGLALGKARLNFDPTALPNTSFVALMLGKTIPAADLALIPGVKVNVYAGPTGSTSGQFGKFASVVAEARDSKGMGFVRRLELTQESFAKFAYWTDDETPGGTTIYFGPGDQLWGPVWSNDVIHLSGATATFNDEVATAKTVSGAGYGLFKKGYKENQKSISLPSTASLGTLAAIATVEGWNFTVPSSTGPSSIRTRIEFVAVDMNGDGDTTDPDEGFFRVYTANSSSNADWLRGDYPGYSTKANVTQCGDWHVINGSATPKFFPVSVHATSWFQTLMDTGGGMSSSQATTEQGLSVSAIMGHAGARCFLGGDPYLASVARTTGGGYTNAQIQIGGDPTTFSATDQYGAWVKNTDTPLAAITAKRPADAKYLFPIYRGYNSAAKGVIYSSGRIGVSGTVRGLVTLYAKDDIVVLDDLKYANDPITGLCLDMMGLLTDKNVVVADNALNTPQAISSGNYMSMDDTKDVYMQTVVMALGTSFNVENFANDPNDSNDCDGQANGRGCLYLTGGIIQQTRGPVGQTDGHGFTKRYSYDRCAIVNPPPYFPTTGRFTDNRYYELDPIKFNINALYLALTPDK